VAVGKKRSITPYGAPERKRHSHEHRNKDRNFPLGFLPASNRYLRRTLIEIFRCQETAPRAINEQQVQEINKRSV
jgi:hypothetical protein